VIAAVADRYGGPEVLSVREVPDLPAPPSGRVLVRVRAASLNPLDAKLRAGALRPFGRLRFPAVLGFDLAGEVVAAGPGVERLAVGDRVYGRIDGGQGGTLAQFALVDAAVLDRVPDALEWTQAAALPLVTMTVLQAFDLVRLAAGQRLLVHGSTGGVGSAAVQIARAIGADVTEVPRGAPAPSSRFDVLFDATGRMPWDAVRVRLAAGGAFVTTGFTPAIGARRLLGALRAGPRVRFVVSRADGALMRRVGALVERGALVPVVDSTFALADVGDAFRRLESGRARGKVVVQLP
jgi:NADPH:quinone reductase-like Zn-dependent oxidoreductase